MAALCFWYWLVLKMGVDGYREKAAAKRAWEDWVSAVGGCILCAHESYGL